MSGFRSAANLVVTPFSWTINAVARPIGHMFAGAVNYSDVVAQNQKLRYQLGQAQLRANEVWALERQLQQLTTELDGPYIGSLPTLSAQVTTLSPTNFAATVDISKGRDSGVLVGMPVVANGGLVVVLSGGTARTVTRPSSGASNGSRVTPQL